MSTQLIQQSFRKGAVSLPLRSLHSGNEFRIDKDVFIQSWSYAIKDFEIIEKDSQGNHTGVSKEDVKWFRDLQENHGRKFGRMRTPFEGDPGRIPNKFFKGRDPGSVTFSENPRDLQPGVVKANFA